MVSKIYQVAELVEGCICDHEYCNNYFCGANPHYNWLNPEQPIGIKEE